MGAIKVKYDYKKKKIVLLFVIICCLTFESNAQNYIPYYNLINEAEFKIYNNDYEGAIILINEAFKVEEPLAKDYYLLATCLAKVNPQKNQEEIRSLLKKASQNGDIHHWMEEEPINLELSEMFLDSISMSSKQWLNKTQTIRDTIKYFTAKDQEYRNVFHDSIEIYYNKESKELLAYKKLMVENDSLTQVQFLNYINQNGYPGTQSGGTGRVGIILLHLNENLMYEFDSLLLEQLKKGNIYPYYYGSMIDRLNHVLNKKTQYLAYFKSVESLDSSQIINNRLKIGMSPYFQGPRRFVNISKSTLLELP